MRRLRAAAEGLCCRRAARGARTMASATAGPAAVNAGTASGGDVLDLGKGWPSYRLLPSRAVALAAAAATTEVTLHYAPAQGDAAFRQAVASLIDAATPRTEACPALAGARVSADAIMQTSGASNGLAMAALASHPRTGDVCLVETATYWFAHAVLQDAGFELDAVPRQANGGLDLEGLARKLSQPRVRALYLVHHTHTQTHTHTHTQTHACVHACIRTCTHTLIHSRTCMHPPNEHIPSFINVHVYTHTLTD